MLAMVESKENQDYLVLKETLDNEFNMIIEKCTMTGGHMTSSIITSYR